MFSGKIVVAACGDLMLTNGNVSVTGTVYRSDAYFACYSGYFLDGPSSAICQQNASWGPVIPTCKMQGNL